MIEPMPRVIARVWLQGTAKVIRSRLNIAASVAMLAGGNPHKRYYTVERRWPRWHVVKRYEKETDT